MQNDNWGWQARIGMFIVGNEAVPEAEMWAMMPVNVSIHAARVSAPSPWAAWSADKTDVQLADDLVRGCRQFAMMQLSSVVIGHSSSSFVGGYGWDQAVVAKLSEQLDDDVHVSTNGLDCSAALRAQGLRQPFIVIPPWYDEDTWQAGLTYLQEHGFQLAGSMRHDPGPGWRDLPSAQLYPHGMGFAQNVESLYQQIRAQCPPEADGILIAGTGFRCVAILDILERDLGRPVISANQASLWRSLRKAGVKQQISGFGSLLMI